MTIVKKKMKIIAQILFKPGRIYLLMAVVAGPLILGSCNPSVSTSMTAYRALTRPANEIKVLPIGREQPEGMIKLGSVNVKETGFTRNCDYDLVIFYAQRAAAAQGGDLIHVTTHLPPNFWSKCHQIEADIYTYNESPHNSDAPLITDSLSMGKATPDGWQPDAQIVQIEQPVNEDKVLRLAFSMGIATRIAPLRDEMDAAARNYAQDLLTGSYYSAEIGFNITPHLALGVRYDQMRTSNSSPIVIQPESPADPPRNGTRSDDIRISYVGPQLQWRVLPKVKKLELLLGGSIGYMGIDNQSEFAGLNLDISGYSLGYRGDLSLDYRITRFVGIGGQIGLAGGIIDQVTVKTGSQVIFVKPPPQQGESLARFDFGAGIRLYL